MSRDIDLFFRLIGFWLVNCDISVIGFVFISTRRFALKKARKRAFFNALIKLKIKLIINR